jgi:hypothetical protein
MQTSEKMQMQLGDKDKNMKDFAYGESGAFTLLYFPCHVYVCRYVCMLHVCIK